MDWSNLVNLAVVLGVGTGLGWLLGSRASRTQPGKPANTSQLSTPVSPSPVSEAQVSPTSSENSQSELISELKAQIDQLKLDYYVAEQMCQFKAGFLARVTHELRSPINGLIGAHQLILSDLCDSPEEEREFLANANSSAVKMIDMLDKILDVSRIESGKSPMKLEYLQLVEVFEEVRYLTEMQAANRNIPLKIVNPNPDIYIRADEQWLTPALVNLVDSAITPDELGSISVWAETSIESGNVHILISAPRSPESWTEAVDLLTKELNRQTKRGAKELASSSEMSAELYQEYPLQTDPDVSGGLNLVMTCSILKLMQGQLEVLPTPADAEDDQLTMIQCSLPLADPPPESD